MNCQAWSPKAEPSLRPSTSPAMWLGNSSKLGVSAAESPICRQQRNGATTQLLLLLEMGRLAGFRYREIVRRLKVYGFEFNRQAAGSHEIWFNPTTSRYTTVPNHPGETCLKEPCGRF